MINQDKWVASLPKNNNQFNEEINQLDPNKWVNTISKPNTFSSIKKYSLTKIEGVPLAPTPLAKKDDNWISKISKITDDTYISKISKKN